MTYLPPPLPGRLLDYAASTSPYAACPHCGAFAAKAVTFTWWGGLIGPKMLTHVKCQQCGTTYNGKSGKSNTTAIIIYTMVGALLGVVVFFVLLKMV